MIITTADTVPGHRVTATLGLVRGNTIRARHLGRDIVAGLRNLVGGEGGFLLRASGQGKVVLSTYGALDRFELQPGQQVIHDTNHMVAFAESVQMELKRASESLMKSAKTGEGLVFVFTGPGELMMQSRNPDDIVQYIYRNKPGSRN